MMHSSLKKNIVPPPSRIKRAPFFESRFTIAQSNDGCERQADAMADQALSVPAQLNGFFTPTANLIQRKCAQCEHEEKQMQRKESSSATPGASSQVSSYFNASSSKGSPLPDRAKIFFEPIFRRDLSDVKIHTDTQAAKSAQSINAYAYTAGNNIFFNENQFSPDTHEGKKLLAHELTHVAQQHGPTIHRKEKPKIDRETFIRENCIGVDVDTSKAECEFTREQEPVVRIAKEYAIRECSQAMFALEMIKQEELNGLSKLIFHEEKSLPRKIIRETIEKVRTKLETIPVVCKNCFDENCNKGGIFAYTPDEHTEIDICPLFFNKQEFTSTPRYFIHEGCHLADIDKENPATKAHNEGYCKMGGSKFDYWNNPCPEDIDNLINADAWAFFIDRLSLFR